MSQFFEAFDHQTPFYEGGQRAQLIEQLEHFAAFSDQVLAITGPHNVGKTRLLAELIDLLNEQFRVVALSASVGQDRELMHSIMDELGLYDVEKERLEDSFERLREAAAEDLRDSGLRTIILIDDVDALDEYVVRAFIDFFSQLTDQDGLIVVLSGNQRLNEELNLASSRLGKEWLHQVTLKPFNRDETHDFLKHIASQMGDVDEIADSKVASVFAQSRGLPGQIEALYLGDNGSQSSPKPDAIPKATIILLLLATSALLAAALLFVIDPGSEGEETEPEQETIVQELQSSLDSIGLIKNKVGAKSLEEQEENTSRKELASQKDLTGGAVEAQEEKGLGQESSENQTLETAQKVASSKQERVAPSTEQARLDKVVAEVREESNDSTSIAPEDASQSLKNEPSEPSESAKALGQVVASDYEEPREKESRIDSTGFVEGAHPAFRSRQWYEQRGNGATVQLLGSYNETTAIKFVDKHESMSPAPFFIKTRHRDKDWYVVLWGSFLSKDEARQAVKTLPATLQKLGPWVREIQAVQSTFDQP